MRWPATRRSSRWSPDTWEAGLRGKPEISFIHNLSWNAGAFRAENRNDILFVSSVQLGTGYFQNFAKTRREGFDADLDGRIGRVTWGLDYTFLLATYQSNADRRWLGKQHQRQRACLGIRGLTATSISTLAIGFR